jgi:hypothetical protein
MNNFFLYRMAESKRHRFIVWDKDGAFLVPDYQILFRVEDNVLLRRALAYTDLRELYFQVLESAARSVAEEDWLAAEIGRIAELVAPVVEQDGRKPFSTEAFYESVEILKEFARFRPAFVLRQVAEARARR